MFGQLFGRQNPENNLWVDGLVSKWLRDSTLTCDTMAELLTSQSSEKQRFARMVDSLSHVKKWLVLDGPMDDTWLENMGTLLDSTRALSLPNGESIAQPGEVTQLLTLNTHKRWKSTCSARICARKRRAAPFSCTKCCVAFILIDRVCFFVYLRFSFCIYPLSSFEYACATENKLWRCQTVI